MSVLNVLKIGFNVALILVLSCRIAQGQSGTVIGTVGVLASDGQPVAIAGVRLTLTCATKGASTTVTNDEGQFLITNVPVGNCAVVTDVQGFKPVTVSFRRSEDEQTELPIFLEGDVLYTGLTVTGVPLDVAPVRPSVSSANVSACKTPFPSGTGPVYGSGANAPR